MRHALRCDLSDVLNATGKVALIPTLRQQQRLVAHVEHLSQPAGNHTSSSSVKQVSGTVAPFL